MLLASFTNRTSRLAPLSLSDWSALKNSIKLKEIDIDFISTHSLKDPMILARFEPTRWGWNLGINALKYLNPAHHIEKKK